MFRAVGCCNARNEHLATSSGAIAGNVSVPARVMGSGTGAVFELALFHPMDTVAKRLMSNRGALRGNVGEVVFREAANKSALQKWASLFPGVGFGAAYKILQRVYKFGGQPFVAEYLDRHYGGVLGSRVMAQALGGSILGIGEVVLLPLDVLKIKAQTNPEVLKGRGLISLVRAEGMRLYAGAGWTMARNAPGSFALFGGNAWAKRQMGLEESMVGKASLLQNFAASSMGATASIVVSQPLDVVKTRIQARPFDAPESGTQIIKKLLKEEGGAAFFKGVTPKLMVVGPKIVFSMTIAQSLIHHLQEKGW